MMDVFGSPRDTINGGLFRCRLVHKLRRQFFLVDEFLSVSRITSLPRNFDGTQTIKFILWCFRIGVLLKPVVSIGVEMENSQTNRLGEHQSSHSLSRELSTLVRRTGSA